MNEQQLINIYGIIAKSILFNGEKIFISCGNKIRFEEVIDTLIKVTPRELINTIQRTEKQFFITLLNNSEITCEFLEKQLEVIRGKRIDVFPCDDVCNLSKEDLKEILDKYTKIDM